MFFFIFNFRNVYSVVYIYLTTPAAQQHLRSEAEFEFAVRAVNYDLLHRPVNPPAFEQLEILQFLNLRESHYRSYQRWLKKFLWVLTSKTWICKNTFEAERERERRNIKRNQSKKYQNFWWPVITSHWPIETKKNDFSASNQLRNSHFHCYEILKKSIYESFSLKTQSEISIKKKSCKYLNVLMRKNFPCMVIFTGQLVFPAIQGLVLSFLLIWSRPLYNSDREKQRISTHK